MDPKRLGQILVAEGLIGDDQLAAALTNMKATGGSLLMSLVGQKTIEEEPLANFLAHQFGCEVTDLAGFQASPQARQMLPAEFAKAHRLIPLAYDKQNLTVATDNPGEVDAPAQQELRRLTRMPATVKIVVRVAAVEKISSALAALYPAGAAAGFRGHAGGGSGDIQSMDGGELTSAGRSTSADPTEVLDPAALLAQVGDSIEVTSDTEGGESYSVGDADEAPVRKMANYFIAEASRRRASDIHINPTATGITIRYRIDGVLQTMPSPPPSMKKGLIARFKVMANMNITERRKPQDGRIKIKLQDRTIDLRVSVIPQMDGENIVMRILDQSSLQLDLRKLGFEPQELARYEESIRSPYGMILHTGPTGSGKTTTLYSALSYIHDPKKSFMTLEDPIEYELQGIVQVQMENDAGLDFATALRSALRQDPNVLMVGEIRDAETARTAVSAALTGHLLFSTLHTNDAPSTIARLIDIGIQPAYVGTAVRMICAQRLMRRVCADCKQPVTPTEEELKLVGVTRAEAEGGSFVKGVGCPKCNMSGYKGRQGIYEMMVNTPALAEGIFRSADTLEITKIAEAGGMRTLRNLAIEKWKNGITTLEEVQRVTMGDH